ncbi:MAG: penicillin-binding protein 2 [Anaerolineaceae bacterium]|jgi:penicillin-binding protein 2
MNTHQSHNYYQIWRLVFVYGLIVLVFGFLALRLFSLQIVQGSAFSEQAVRNKTREVSVQTQRGIIFDRNGVVLARNVASYNVVITPADLPNFPEATLADTPGEVQEIYRQLSTLIGIPVSRGDVFDQQAVRLFRPCENDFGITEIVYIGNTNAPYRPVQIKCNVDREIAMTIQERASDWPGVSIQIEPIREYPTGYSTAEVVGFLGPIPAIEEQYWVDLGFVSGRDKVGYAGIEAQFNDILIGRNGERVIQVDVAGREIRELEPPVEPIPGDNVVLTIDTRLQNMARQALIRMMRRMNTRFGELRMSSGVVIAMNVKTGEILAMVSEPSYENNRMARYIPTYYFEQLQRDRHKPLLNHAITAEHPPGSVYKMAPAIAILNERVVTPEEEFFCPGKITIQQRFSENEIGVPRDYVCWDRDGHGYADFFDGVAWSCDVYWYKVGGGYRDEVPGNGLGVWRMAEYARALGYGAVTGIELPAEADGLVPDPTWKRVTQAENWSTGDTYIATMGQGFVLSTPLQALVSLAILANDGKYMQPTIIREIRDSEGNVIRPFEPRLKWDITKDPVIRVFDENNFLTGETKVVEPWVIELTKESMRQVVLPGGTADTQFEGEVIPSAGKTGTAEYCDDIAMEKGRCEFGKWPAHAWYVGYAPYDDPEIAVVAFVYNGGEGSTVAAPIVRWTMEAYFELKAMDAARGN